MKTALLFSGQGSQYVGMMKDMYDTYSESKILIDNANDILGFPISDICFNGPIEKLKETRYTQPALFIHSAVAFHLIKDSVEFAAVAGHSIGEYAALYAAGAIDFEDALRLVALRGELMFRAGQSKPGTMFAVINLAGDKVEEVCRKLSDNTDGNVVVVANFNSPGQIVVSGSAEYLRANAAAFKDAGARMAKELVVSGAFHSPLMNDAKDELETAIDAVDFRDALVPVYTNADARPTTAANQLKASLVRQLISPVLWTQTMENMFGSGIANYIEVGAGSVLQGLVKRTLSDISFSGIDKADDLTQFIN